MEWFRVIELMITSLTSIVIALVGAGFFRRMTDRKEKSKSKVDIMQIGYMYGNSITVGTIIPMHQCKKYRLLMKDVPKD